MALDWTYGAFTQVKYQDATISGLDYKANTARFTLGLMSYPGAGP